MSSTTTLNEQATIILHTLVGSPDARFHDGQFEAIEALVEGGRRALVVQRTGWGKSAVYFIACDLLRQQGRGPVLVLSPLLVLMRNQIEAATRLGLTALTFNSSLSTEWIHARLPAARFALLVWRCPMRCQRTSGDWPVARASCRSRSGTPKARSSGV